MPRNSRFSILLPVFYVARRKTPSGLLTLRDPARSRPILFADGRTLAEVARCYPKIARCAISSRDDALVVQYLVHAYAPIYVRHDALPMQTCYVEHGRRETTPSRWKSNEGSSSLASLNIARIMHRIPLFSYRSSMFSTVSKFPVLRRTRSINFLLLFEIMLENNGFSVNGFSYHY